MSLLTVRDLGVAYTDDRPVLAGVDLSVAPGEIVGVIGETGSGKTTLARAIVGLAPVTAGRIEVDGRDVTGLRGRALRGFRRGGTVQLMFQDPLRALDPQLTVRAIVAENLVVAGSLRRSEVDARVDTVLDLVGLSTAIADRRPGRLSGGQRQRVLLARAIAPRPRLLIADEPVSALDASNRNHVLRLLDDLRTGTGLAIMVISHDLSSLAGIADRVTVLYGGRSVEQGPIRDVLHDPAHPYTALLTASAPSVRRIRLLDPADLRRPDDGTPIGTGCVFAHRCAFATGTCRRQPDTRHRPGERSVACHHADNWRDLLPALTKDREETK